MAPRRPAATALDVRLVGGVGGSSVGCPACGTAGSRAGRRRSGSRPSAAAAARRAGDGDGEQERSERVRRGDGGGATRHVARWYARGGRVGFVASHHAAGPADAAPTGRSALVGARRCRAGTLRRAWSFARPYRGADRRVPRRDPRSPRCSALVPPLVVRAILDTAIPDGDRAMITLAGRRRRRAPPSATPLLQIVQRWCSARVGEGLIFDLRRALFAKVQRMPVAFFTRTPTGAMIVPAEQRRHRRPDGRHEHTRQRRQQRRRARHDARRDDRPRVAADAARARGAAAVRRAGPARSGGACRRSPASRCSTTRR